MPHACLSHPHAVSARTDPRMLIALLSYAALVVYGSLYPFTRWHSSAIPSMAFLLSWPSHLDKADLLQNILVYAPFGLLTALWLACVMPAVRALLWAILLGTLLSLAMECLQQFNPTRVSSAVDIAMNALGSGLGALIASVLLRHTLPGTLAMAWRDRWFRCGSMANTGLVILAIWILSQTSPFVPTLDISHLRRAVSGLWRTLQHPEQFELPRALAYSFLLAGVGAMCLLLARPGKPIVRLFALTLSTVLLIKAIVIGRVLSLEACAGAAAAFAALLLMRALPMRWLPLAGMLSIAAGFTISELIPGPSWIVARFNWTPFAGQMRSEAGLSNILELLWIFMALSWFVRLVLPGHGSRFAACIGVLITAAAAFWLEWQQQWTGRYGDITQVMLCVAGWLLPWCVRPRYESLVQPI